MTADDEPDDRPTSAAGEVDESPSAPIRRERADLVAEPATVVVAAAEVVVPSAAADPSATSSTQLRASSSGDGDDTEPDLGELAAFALRKLGQRARTDFAELRVQYQRLDGLVIVLAFVIVLGAAWAHRRMLAPPLVTFDEHGLSFARQATWLAPERIPLPPPRLIQDVAPPRRTGNDELPYRVGFTHVRDGNARLEVLVDKLPTWSNIVTGLELDRRSRWGELYALEGSAVRSIKGHDWLRTAFRYAYVAEKGDLPQIGRAVEYATIDHEQLYAVTFFGNDGPLAEMERVIAPSLRVASRSGLPLLPQVGRLGRREFPAAVGKAFPASVMVVAADLVDGRLRARGGGSGVVVAGDGSILTNFHVVHDREGRLHDLFIVGRYDRPDQPPELVCAGHPSRSKLQRELDLALIKCDLDLDGRAWSPDRAEPWPTLPVGKLDDVQPGERLWVIGYPDVGGGGLTLSQGLVEGMTGEDGGLGRDYIKTDASITHGNSGGPVIDDDGKLIGVATAFRVRVDASGGVIETSKVGLVRPLASAADLLAIARAGWTPREGYNTVDLAPTAVEAPAEGVRIETTILSASNDVPVMGALLMVLRPGVPASEVDMNRLDEMVISWGRSNALGKVYLKHPVPTPGSYGVLVVARGYRPLVGDGALILGEDAKDSDPWGQIRIEPD